MQIDRVFIDDLYFTEDLISSQLFSKISHFIGEYGIFVTHTQIVDSLPTFLEKSHFLVAILASLAHCEIQDDFLKDLEYLINTL